MRAGHQLARILLFGIVVTALGGCTFGLRYVHRDSSDPRWMELELPSATAPKGPSGAALFASYAVMPAQRDASVGTSLPDLFDAYVLAAVQQQTGATVIGQDDINAMLGLENQRALAGCDDATCLAEVGGALGVKALVSMQIARLEGDWVVTGKVVDLSRVVVVQRISEFVSGDTKALLEAVPEVVGKLLL